MNKIFLSLTALACSISTCYSMKRFPINLSAYALRSFITKPFLPGYVTFPTHVKLSNHTIYHAVRPYIIRDYH